MILSKHPPAEATSLPSGLNATDQIVPVCPLRGGNLIAQRGLSGG